MSTINKTLKSVFPKSHKKAFLKYFSNKPTLTKHTSELSFWKDNYKKDNNSFRNNWYEKIMLAMAQEKDSSFLEGKIVADFGCGPRGSLSWLKNAALLIGIDVLSDIYIDEFTDCLLKHNMVYLKSTEKAIPMPDNSIDVIFTLNAMDHVDNFEQICNEIIRVLKPGGDFIGSFNLEEPSTVYEPQCLNEDIIQDKLLSKMEKVSYRIARSKNLNNPYEPFYTNNLEYKKGEEGVLWLRSRKVQS